MSFNAEQSIHEARKAALQRLLSTTMEMKAALEADEDIEELLERREEDCRRFVALSCDPHMSLSTDGEQAEMSAPPLDHACQELVEQIFACQSECESIMTSRLESLASAIRESVRKRNLVSAYGTSAAGDAPVFLDRQQ
ncbi:MAG: hypothetical protein N3B12_05900 [Armatimonadetes bacterium]|nr:hypothetical protein [Armatimonadota bacterium]